MLLLALAKIVAAAVLLAAGFALGQEQAQVPQDVVKEWSYLIGDWRIEGTVGGRPLVGTASYHWARGKHCYIGEQVWTLGRGNITLHLTSVAGWDAENNETVEHGFDSAGSVATVRYDTKKPPVLIGVIEGQASGASRGQKWSAKVQVERKGPDEYAYTTFAPDGGRIHALNYRKAAKQTE